MAPPSEPFGQALEPAILQACQPYLRDLHWFRTDWQRGGALTGYAHWHSNDPPVPVVAKLPVPPQELLWLERLQADRHAHGPVVPRLMAGGRELGGYDLAWVVMQRMPYGPLDKRWNGLEVRLLSEAAARFYAAGRSYPIDKPPRQENWPQTLTASRQVVRDVPLAQPQQWAQALKAVHKSLPRLLAVWDQRPVEDWCHGDLHFGNAMTDSAPPGGPAVLFDLARLHAGHWVEDAVYFESLFWEAPQRLGHADVVKSIAVARKAIGIKGGADWPRLADIRRALVASAVPAQQATRPDPVHLHAALVTLEAVLPRL